MAEERLVIDLCDSGRKRKRQREHHNHSDQPRSSWSVPETIELSDSGEDDVDSTVPPLWGRRENKVRATSERQIQSDEALARRLAQEDESRFDWEDWLPLGARSKRSSHDRRDHSGERGFETSWQPMAPSSGLPLAPYLFGSGGLGGFGGFSAFGGLGALGSFGASLGGRSGHAGASFGSSRTGAGRAGHLAHLSLLDRDFGEADYEMLLQLDEVNEPEKKRALRANAKLLDQLSSRRVKKADEKDEATCVICLEQLKAGQSVTDLRCKHAYHRGCILKWLKSCETPTCPQCKLPALGSGGADSPPAAAQRDSSPEQQWWHT
jgi:hypothetical protein